MNALYHDDAPTTAREGLETLEFLAQDHYSIDPNLRRAVALLKGELERVTGLEKVLDGIETVYAEYIALVKDIGHPSFDMVVDAVRHARSLRKGGD